MAIFAKKEKKENSVTTSPKIVSSLGVNGKFVHSILPRITEKASMMMEKGVYVFDIKKEVTKGAVADAIFTFYKVKPLKVRIVNTKAKKIVSKGKKGRSTDSKKAYVYLKSGDKIDLA